MPLLEVKIPPMGESITSGVLAKWHVKDGDTVKKDQALFELETDKITSEAAAEAGGRIILKADAGAEVKIGQVVAVIETGEGAGAPAAPAAPAARPAVAAPAPSASSAGAAASDVQSPAVKRLAGETGIDPSTVSGSGKAGRVTKGDMLAAASQTDPTRTPVTRAPGDAGAGAGSSGSGWPGGGSGGSGAGAAGGAGSGSGGAGAGGGSAGSGAGGAGSGAGGAGAAGAGSGGTGAAGAGSAASTPGGSASGGAAPGTSPSSSGAKAAAPAAAAAAGGAGERQTRKKMSPLRQRIAQRLVAAQHEAAMLTTFNEVDMSAVMALRAKYQDDFTKRNGIKLGFMSFFTKAVVHALQAVPAVNAQIDGDSLVQNNFYDVGVAVSTEKGLMVPVIRNCDRLGMADIEKSIGDAAKRAREGKITLADLEGGVFTITNGGIFGSMLSTPIINPPQSAILGLHSINERPIALNGQVVIRPMMYLALSYDHRIVDGREAVTFLVKVKQAIEDPQRLLLGL